MSTDATPDETPDRATDGVDGEPADEAPEAPAHGTAAEDDDLPGGGPQGIDDPDRLVGGAAELVARRPVQEMPPRRTGVFLDPRDLRGHVGDLLRTTLGGYEVDPVGNFTFTHNDARVFVTVGPSQVGPQVGVFSITNVGLDLSPQLAAFLVTTNHRLGFGAFSYDPENKAVWLRHSLLGTMLDGPELQTAVLSVATTAAHFDGLISDRFGGHTFQQATSEEQQRARPPEPAAEPGDAVNASGYL